MNIYKSVIDGSQYDSKFSVTVEKCTDSIVHLARSNYIGLGYSAEVFIDNQWEPLNFNLVCRGDLEPHIRGSFDQNLNIIQIENIQRGCIISGQKFLRKTLDELINLLPECQQIYFANVNNPYTLKILMRFSKTGDPITLEKDEKPGPLISVLEEMGCSNIELVKEGSCYGVRGMIS